MTTTMIWVEYTVLAHACLPKALVTYTNLMTHLLSFTQTQTLNQEKWRAATTKCNGTWLLYFLLFWKIGFQTPVTAVEKLAFHSAISDASHGSLKQLLVVFLQTYESIQVSHQIPGIEWAPKI